MILNWADQCMSEKLLILRKICLFCSTLTMRKLKYFMPYTIRLHCKTSRRSERWTRNRQQIIFKNVCISNVQNVDQKMNRSRHRRCSVRKGVLRNFAKFTGKHLWQSLFFNKVAGWGLQLKKSLWHRCFPVNFARFLRKPFL